MKWIGILLVFLAFGLWGAVGAWALQRRANDLQELYRALQVLQGEIRWRQAGLRAVALAHGEVAFLARWAEQMETQPVEEACLAAAAPLALTEEERRLLEEFARSAGKLDREGQLAQWQRLEERLRELCAATREESKNKGCVRLALALCLGGMAGLLLL